MTILDTFGDFTPGLSSPICGGFDIAPDDVVDLPNVTRAIVLASGGDVSVVLKNGDAITLPGLTAGVIYPVRVSRVLVTGTTATGLKGLI
ncbi:MAG: hypothetical protein OSA49_06875 [Ascidiaceihabitans sp.]|nr:hypothetical protein [Ascidiaceihabitans sp.]